MTIEQPNKVEVGVRTWECNVTVDNALEGTIENWPANVQDKIYSEMDKLSKLYEIPLAMVHSSCQIDYGDPDNGEPDEYYLKIILSEIIIGDSRKAHKHTSQ